MAANEIHKDDVGIQFRITVNEDGSAKNLSGFSTLQLIFKKPSGSKLTKTASFLTDGTDGIITYTSASGDLDEDGNWFIQARIADGGSDRKSDIGKFKVHDNL